jgi:hypothetical protein
MNKVRTTVLLLAFNRPSCFRRLVESLSCYSFAKIILNVDGPRHQEDALKINEVIHEAKNLNPISDVVDVWVSSVNLGCKTSCMNSLKRAFESEDRLIVLEDDCIPGAGFFEFMEFGLDLSENSLDIAHVSGSNLVAHKIQAQFNVKSIYINNWGWGMTSAWFSRIFPDPLWANDVSLRLSASKTFRSLSFFEKNYWIEIFKHSILSRTIWDFYLQFGLFENSCYSLVPRVNLVNNIGFSGDATHMNRYGGFPPPFVKKNWASCSVEDSLFAVHALCENSQRRDKLVLRMLWKYSIVSLLRIKIGNVLRFALL